MMKPSMNLKPIVPLPLFMIGAFGSRRISFTDKGKRDECIYWLTSFGGSQIGLANETEFSE
jgi:hypothetical protein